MLFFPEVEREEEAGLAPRKGKGTKVSKKRKSRESKKKSGTRPETQVLKDFVDPNFESSDEDVDVRNGGAKITPVLLKVSKPAWKTTKIETVDVETGARIETVKKTGKKRVRCIGSAGCGQVGPGPATAIGS